MRTTEARIVSTPGICGGSARIANTRIPVWTLVEARRLGATDGDLLRDFPSLELEDLEVAMAYAEDHADEIDRDIREQDEG